MNEDLREKYPDLFEHCWDLSTGPGWHTLIDELLSAIKEEIVKSGIVVNVRQVKSKFAGLRFYYDGGNEVVHQLVDKAEEKSYHICEECGQPGKQIDRRGWLWTLCDKCLDNKEKQ